MMIKINYLDKKKGLNKNTAVFIYSNVNLSRFEGTIDSKIYPKISEYLKKNKNSKDNKIISLNQDFDQNLIVIYLSKKNGELESEKLGAKFYDFLKSKNIYDIHIKTPETKNYLDIESFIHGVELKSYEFNLYKTKKNNKTINIFVDKSALSKKSKKLNAILNGVNLTRDLVSEPGNILHPDEYAKRVSKLKNTGLKITIYD